MRCVWAPQVPSQNPTPQSLLLGVQGPQVHSAHSLPGPPFFTLSATPGNRAQDLDLDSPFLGSGLTWAPAPFQSPAPAVSPFFLATAEVSASKARRARRRKLRRCILRGEHGSESSPHPGGRRRGPPPPPTLPQFPGQAQRVGLLLRRTWGGRPLAASPGAQREESPRGPPGAWDAAQTPSPPPDPR